MCYRKENWGYDKMEYDVAIGLEVHAELKTNSKIYCSCKNEFSSEVNTSCCPVCMGMPGTMPVLNEKVIEYAVKIGLALGCSINRCSKMDRKSYFYPDLPKAYQISQFHKPLCENGYLDIDINDEKKRIGIKEIHIEEDAGKLIHTENEHSLIDYNRCGVPLIEIVTEPDMRSASEAKEFLDQIKLILKYLEISDCKMEQGSIRCDVNVSIMEKGSDILGKRCEMKNINSFSSAVRAIEYEYQRQLQLLSFKNEIVQETRRWDDVKHKSFTLRTKGNSTEYCYFPEPDLPLISLDEEYITTVKQSICELPCSIKERFLNTYKLSNTEADILIQNKELADFFDEAARLNVCQPRSICNWLLGDILKYMNDTKKSIKELCITSNAITSLIIMNENGEISNTSAKAILSEIISGCVLEPCEIAIKSNLLQLSDENELEEIISLAVLKNSSAVNDYQSGNSNAFEFLLGQCIKLSEKRGNPVIMRKLLRDRLNN